MYIHNVQISYTKAKRDWTLSERKLDFDDFPQLFDHVYTAWEDLRHDYGERRYIMVGYVNDRLIVAVWTPRNEKHHIVSMRKANKREKANFEKAVNKR